MSGEELPVSTGAADWPSKEDHAALRLWLNLLNASQAVKSVIRHRLHEQFDTSLARFDFLAQLHRAPDGLRMQEISTRLMVTGGNVTGLTDSLEREGLVKRSADPADRRAFRVSLTAAGRKRFAAMALAHEKWITDVLGAVSKREMQQLQDVLSKIKRAANLESGR
jgi:DNA-binding MarR family transcriptional regulator